MTTTRYSLDDLCAATQLDKRTIRYYIQQGILARPEGEKRGAYYTHSHLEQLARIANLKNDGLSLERIRELMSSSESGGEVPVRPIGHMEVWSRINLGEGLELCIEPTKAEISPEQLRKLVGELGSLIAAIKGDLNE